MYKNRRMPRSSIDHPNIFVAETSINLALPNTTWAIDNFGLSSSGIGRGLSSIFSGLGEFLERRHFFSQIPISMRGRLAEVMSDQERSEWMQALMQTGSAEASDIDQHNFPLTRVIDKQGNERMIPAATVKISSISEHGHDDFFRYHDTSGCSAHVNLEAAILSSVKEQIERQCLLIFWLTGSIGQALSGSIVELSLGDHAALYRKLTRNGTLSFFDITIPGCPGYAVLIVYTGTKNTLVKYCPGLSYALNVESAIRKAFLEMWQSYSFLVAMNSSGGSSEELTDRYHRYFLLCNNIETAEKVCRGEGRALYEVRDPMKSYSFLELLSYINTTLPYWYLYIGLERLNLHNVYMTKFLSPGFFLQMDNSACNNLKNRVSSEFHESFLPNRVSTMVPFP